MENTCFNCNYLDRSNSTTTFFSTKYYCGAMGRYVSGDQPACARFIERQYGGGCYLTTACVEYKGLADDCYELTTLRQFRDEYVRSLENGEELIKRYYDVAPRIVECIDASPNKDEIYQEIYQYILKCIEHINRGEYVETLSLYTTMVEEMTARYILCD